MKGEKPMQKEKPVPDMKLRLMRLFGVTLALAILILPSPVAAAADSYPNKPIRLIIAFAPGGSTDIVARMIAAKLSERLGKQVVPDNRGGGGGTIGMEAVAKAEPDGYTLLFTSSAIATNPLLYTVPFDPVKSFIPVAKVGNGPAVLTVHPGVPANSVKELIALAKKQPGKLVCASAGVGSFVHMSSELFKMMAGIDFKIVQFKGGGPAMIDVMGGHSQILAGTLTMTMPNIKSGKLKALGYAASARTKLMPELPTVSEAGLPGYESAIWWGFFAPAGTPKEIADRLYKEIAAIMNSDEMKQTFDKQGSEIDLMDSAGFTKFIEAEMVKWGKVVKEGNIKGEDLK
jgi:tripartite-type tricarboxylate transporter receptor subunit TctC